MAKFDFRLEALLTHRSHIEKDKQRAVAVIQQKILGLQRGIQDTQNRIADEDKRLGSAELTGMLDMQYIAREKRFVGNLRLRIAMAQEKIREFEIGLASAKAALLEAAKARKVLEILRDKQLARWRAEQDRKETAQLDDVASQSMARSLIF